MGNPEIERLGTLLAQNHVLASISRDTLKRHCRWRNIIDDKKDVVFKPRTIAVIVGAGASRKADMPLGKKAIQDLKKEFKINEEAYEYVLKELESVYEYDLETFETNLLAFNRFRPNKMLEVLQKTYLHRYYPLYCYEILAHLLKHRFVDIIINFNFDEFLDQSIEDEVGDGQYYKIISDGDCPDHLLNTAPGKNKFEKPDLPIYIKPHGTASHKSTLRFTREDYFKLPTDMKTLMKKLLIKKDEPLILISVGFDMQSFEFNEIIQEPHLKSEIFYLNIHEPKPKPELKNYAPPKLTKIDDENDLDSIMTELWESTSNTFKDNYEPRGIDRHKILKTIFQNYDNKDKNEENSYKINYFEARATIELLLYAAKSKGLINLSHAAMSRCGTYYDLYQKEMGNSSKTRPFLGFLDEIGFVETNYGYELFQIKDEDVVKPKENRLIVSSDELNSWIKKNVSRIKEIAESVSPKIVFGDEFNDKIVGCFENLYGPEETEIRVRRHDVHNKIFLKPQLLKTKTSLKFKTLALLEKDWNQLLIVAETGQWLLKKEIKEIILNKYSTRKERCKICMRLIVADEFHKEELEYVYKDCNIGVALLNWWEHNRHFTVCLDSGNPICSIYFSRRLRSQDVTPLYLEYKDTKKVLSIFCNYQEKTKNNHEREVDHKKVGNTKRYINDLCTKPIGTMSVSKM